MHIHKVKNGETVYSIAKEYGIQPSKIAEYNGLENKNRLSVGRELLILTPTRTYTVKHGDSLSSVAMRFGTKKRDLIRSNPLHTLEEKLTVGEVLAVKNEAERYGTSVANGYYYQGCGYEKLKTILPYLTYITVSSVINDKSGLKFLFDDSGIVNLAKDNGKIPLLRIYDTSGGEYCNNKKDRFGEEIIDIAVSHGYSGIVLSAYRAAECDSNSFGEYLVNLRKKMIGSNLILFTEIDETSASEAADYADGSILFYDKIAMKEIPKFENGEQAILQEFANTCESTKVFIDIPSLAFCGDKYISIDDAFKLAWNKNAEIMHDDDKKISYFAAGGKKIYFESMENIRAKLQLISELGYMGISFDIMRVPMSTVMIYNSLFKTLSFAERFYS